MDDVVLHPPLRRPLWVATLTCSGRTGASNHKCLGALESSTNQPSGQPVGGGEGQNPAKTRTRAAFLPAGGENWITAGDCGAIVGMPRYRSGSPTDTANHFAWLAPLWSASKKHLKTRIPEPFYTEWTREGCLGNNPLTAEAWPPNGFPKEGGERGGRGANSSKTRVLATFCHRAFI